MTCDRALIHSWVRDLPIVDWHNHLDLAQLAADAPLGSLWRVWVRADPYKHRAMRICGEPENLITGGDEAGGWRAWMRTLPKLVGNPIFAWAEMELAFLGLDAAPYLHGRGENVSLAALTPSRMLRAFNVEAICPCASTPADLASLAGLGAGAFAIRPSFRMSAGDDVPPATLDAFAAVGCRVVDVSVDDAARLDAAFDSLAPVAVRAAERGWTLLLHLGALRETSGRLRRAAGAAGGFAGMRVPADPDAVARFLNRLETAQALPRTILLSLNPEAHAQLAVLSGSFVGAGVAGKVQLGPAWWWCDHREGIFDVFEKSAAYGVLSTFVGMTTDSRSLLSFVRHGYFRRLLARWLAAKVADGDLPDDPTLLRPLAENVCYFNAKSILNSETERNER